MQSPEEYRQTQIGGYGPGTYHLVIGPQNASHDLNKGLQAAPAGMYAPNTAAMPGAGPQHHQPGQPPQGSMVQPQQINHRPIMMNNIQGRPNAQMASLSRNPIANVSQAPPQGAQQYSHVQNVMLQSQVHPSLQSISAPMQTGAQQVLIPQQVFFQHRPMQYQHQHHQHQHQQYFVTHPYSYAPPPSNTYYPMQQMPSCPPPPVNQSVPETQSHKSSQKKILEIINPDTGANVIAEVLSQNERRDHNRSSGSEAAITFATQVAAVAATTESSGQKEEFEPQSMAQRQAVNAFERERESSSFEISTPEACDQYDEDVNSIDPPSLSFSDKDSVEISISDNIPIMPDPEPNIEASPSTEVVVTHHIANHEDLASPELSPEYETTNSEIPDEELLVVDDGQVVEVEDSGNTNCAVSEPEIQNFVEELASPVQSDETAQVLSASPPSEAIISSNIPSEGSASSCNALKLDKLPPEGKKKGKKKKDINKKGDSKEGSEMDAFIGGDSTPTPESPPASVVTQPPLPPPSPEPVSTPLPAPEQLPAVTTVIDDVAIETIVDRSLLNSIPLPNEEKSPEEETVEVQCTEEVAPEEKSIEIKEDGEVSSPDTPKNALKYSYKEDQWSPLNPEGKKQYDRDFLLKMQQQPMSLKKPINLPDLDVIKDKAHLHKLDLIARIPPLPMPSRGMNAGFDPFVPQYVRPSPRPQMGHPGMRRSQQGRDNKPMKKVVFSSSLNQSIKLHESENAWKAGTKVPDADETAEIEELNKRVRGILNKLTPQKFHTLLLQVKELNINTEEKLKGVIDLVFEKAIDEPNFSVPYANMCKHLAMMKVPRADKEGECVNFRKLLLTKCQKEFEKDQSDELLRLEKIKQIAECTIESKKKTLQDEFNDEERKNRRRQLGNIRFIGELFKLNMLTEPIMHDCIKKLLLQRDEDSLECLCRLLSTIGKELEVKREKESNEDFQEKKEQINSYFTEMRRIVGERKASSRVRFMLQDVIDLRERHWVPRRDDNNPKTIDQIHKEAEKEAHEQQLALQNMQFNAPKRPPEDNRKKNTNQGREVDGWTVTSRTAKMTGYSNNLDPSKLKAFGRPEIESIQLGPSGRGFMSWGRGSSGGYNKTNEQESKPATVLSSNRYMALSIDQSMQNVDTRRGSQRSAASSRESSRGRNNQMSPMIRKTPSASKERENAIEATMQFARASQAEQKAKESAKVPEVKNVNGKDATVPTDTSALKGGEISRDEMEKKTKPLIDEFLHTGDFEEATRCVMELVSSNTMHMFITDAINQVLERSSQARSLFGQLLQKLVKMKLLTMDQYNKGMWSVLEFVDDFALDIPKIWEYLGELIQPMIDSNSVSLKFLEETLRPCIPSLSAGKVMAAILHCAAKASGQLKISEMWKESGLNWSMFLPPGEDISQFTSVEKLEFIVSPARVELPPAEVEKKLATLLKDNQIDNIFEWIDGNLSPEKVKEPVFVRTLVTSIFENAISGSAETCELSQEKVQSCLPLLALYVGKEKEIQLPALYALQALVTRLSQPKGILKTIFDILYDDDIIHEDSFIKWDESNDPAEQEGKGVAKASAQQFLTWLRENDSEEG